MTFLLAVGMAACGTSGDVDPEPAPASGTDAAAGAQTGAAEDDRHEHIARHGGTLLELGDHFASLELLFDAEIGTITVWVLDEEAENPIRVVQPTIAILLDAPPSLAKRPLELDARANALTGERPGDASEFGFAHEALRGLHGLRGRVIEVTVRSVVFRDVPFDIPAGTHP